MAIFADAVRFPGFRLLVTRYGKGTLLSGSVSLETVVLR